MLLNLTLNCIDMNNLLILKIYFTGVPQCIYWLVEVTHLLIRFKSQRILIDMV